MRRQFRIVRNVALLLSVLVVHRQIDGDRTLEVTIDQTVSQRVNPHTVDHYSDLEILPAIVLRPHSLARAAHRFLLPAIPSPLPKTPNRSVRHYFEIAVQDRLIDELLVLLALHRLDYYQGMGKYQAAREVARKR